MRAAVLILCCLPLPALACPSGAKCISVETGGLSSGNAGKWLSVPQAPPPVEIGQILPEGRYRMMFNTGYYGLPPVADGWVYYRVDDDIYRVGRDTLEVLERVTHQANRAF